MTDDRVSLQQDRLRFQPQGRSWRVVRIELQPLFDRLGVSVRCDRMARERPWMRAARPCKAAWLIQEGVLYLTGVWGRLGRFDWPAAFGSSEWVGEDLDPVLQQHLRATGATRLKQRLFPDQPIGRPVPADWVDQEIVLLEGGTFPSSRGAHWDNFRRHRLITVEKGVVTRSWVRTNDPPEPWASQVRAEGIDPVTGEAQADAPDAGRTDHDDQTEDR